VVGELISGAGEPVGRATGPSAGGKAVALPLAGVTALRTLRLGGSLLGRRVLITGAAGGLGNLLVQLAAAAGARVTAVSTRSGNGSWLGKLGADGVVATVEDAAGPFDLIAESVGGASLAAAIRAIAPGGTIVVLGNSSGEPTPISIYDFFGHEAARLQTYFSYAHHGVITEDLAGLIELVAHDRLTPTLGRVEGWDQVRTAMAALRDRAINGKAVLRITP
jgi:NADPH2:quinone reductase